MMKCQQCDESASMHITEVTKGRPVVYHVCEQHSQDLSMGWTLKEVASPVRSVYANAKLLATLKDEDAQNKVAAFILPGLILALADNRSEVRSQAAFQLMMMGRPAESAIGALKNALDDEDEFVREVAQAAIDHIQTCETWLHPKARPARRSGKLTR